MVWRKFFSQQKWDKALHAIQERHWEEYPQPKGGLLLNMRRQYKRIPLRGDEIRVEMMTETSAQLTDLGKHGICLKAPKRLMPGNPCTVTVDDNGSPVILHGTSVWERFAGWVANPSGQADAFFFAGIRFDDERQDLMRRVCGYVCDDVRMVRINASDTTVRLSYAEAFTVLSLSFGGVFAESLNPLKPGTELILRIFLPGNQEPIKCIAKGTSCRPVKSEPEKKYHIGFEFTAMDDAQADRLKGFILMLSAL